jgi:hypothetical protein
MGATGFIALEERLASEAGPTLRAGDTRDWLTSRWCRGRQRQAFQSRSDALSDVRINDECAKLEAFQGPPRKTSRAGDSMTPAGFRRHSHHGRGAPIVRARALIRRLL